MKRICFLVMVLCLVSCQEVITIKLPSDGPKFTVNGLFSADSTWHVEVNRMFDLSSPWGWNFSLVGDAIVTVRDSSNAVIEQLTLREKYFGNLKKKFYGGDSKPKRGKSYFIHVQKQDTILTAINKLPPVVPIIAMHVDSIDNRVDIDITFNDTPGVKNYYKVSMLRLHPGSMTSSQAGQQPVTIRYLYEERFRITALDPVFHTEQDRSEYPREVYFSDDFFEGKRYTLRIRTYRGGTQEFSFPIRIILDSISPEYYQYLVTTELQDRTKEDYFAQPTQVYTNINGGQGIFGGYSRSQMEIK